MLVAHVGGERLVDDPLAGVRQRDHPAALVLVADPARDQAGGLEPVDPLRGRAGGHHRVPGQLARRELVGLPRTPQRRQHVELPLPQPVPAELDVQLVAQPVGQPVQPSVEPLGGHVEVRALATPLLLDPPDVIEVIAHGWNISSREGIIASMEAKWIAVTAFAPVAWGANYVVTRQLLPADVPLWGSALRALPAGLVLLAIARTLPRGAWWWRSAVLGTMNVGAFFLLVYVAAQLLPSSVAASVMALAPLAMAGFGWLLVAERPTPLLLGGSVAGIARCPPARRRRQRLHRRGRCRRRPGRAGALVLRRGADQAVGGRRHLAAGDDRVAAGRRRWRPDPGRRWSEGAPPSLDARNAPGSSSRASSRPPSPTCAGSEAWPGCARPRSA